MTTTADATETGKNYYCYLSTNEGSTNYTGEAGKGIKVEAIQLEQSAYPTPFIDGTRASCNVQDDFSKIYNSNSGTFVFTYHKKHGVNSRVLTVSLSPYNGDNRFALYGAPDSGNTVLFMSNGGVSANCVVTGEDDTETKGVFSYSEDDLRGSVNGSSVVNSVNTMGNPTGLDTAYVGSFGNVNNLYLDSSIKSIKYYAGKTYTDQQMVEESGRVG